MSDINKVFIVGRLVRDPEFKKLNESGVVNFSIAVNGYKKDEVSFLDCQAWSKLAEIVEKYAKKGTQVAIDGTLKQSTWKDSGGSTRSKIVINCTAVQLIGPKHTPMDQESVDPYGDDMPF